MKQKRKKKLTSSAKITTVLICAAVILLIASALGSARAALVFQSENYTAEITVSQIGVSLLENGKIVSSRDYSGSDDVWKITPKEKNEPEGELLTGLLGEDEKLIIGKTYDEVLSVKNTGTIDEYVRVRLYKSWQYEDGTKETALSPELIEVSLPGNGWIEDTSAQSPERRVLYYPNILKSGTETPAFADAVRINNEIMTKVKETRTEENGAVTITQEFAYQGVRFYLRAEVDAVQTHNAEDAIMSAWGVNVNIAPDGTLSLAQ